MLYLKLVIMYSLCKRKLEALLLRIYCSDYARAYIDFVQHWFIRRLYCILQLSLFIVIYILLRSGYDFISMDEFIVGYVAVNLVFISIETLLVTIDKGGRALIV